MNEFNRGFGAVDVRSMDTSVNVGLRTFMLGVYQKLALGIALSGGVAFLVGSGLVPGLTQLLLGTPLFYVFQFGPLALILGCGGVGCFFYWLDRKGRVYHSWFVHMGANLGLNTLGLLMLGIV